MKHFVISERSYEYNDEYYNSTDGGIPIHVANSLQEANDWISERLINDARTGKFYFLASKDLNNYSSYIEEFGSDDLTIFKTSYYNYAHFKDYELPNMAKWDQEKIEKWIKFMKVDFYFVTEL